MSSNTLSEEMVESIKEIIRDTIIQILPDIVKQMTTIIPEIITQITPIIVKTTTDNYSNREKAEVRRKENEKNFNDFRAENKAYMDKKLSEREEKYYKYRRSDVNLELYGECLAEEPVYIPRKFRSDSFHVMNEAELRSVTKFELQRFQSECEILNLRRTQFLKEITTIDDQIEEFIKNKNLNDGVTSLAVSRWNECKTEEIKRIDEKMVKKMESTQEAYAKDKVYITNHQNERIKGSKNKSSPPPSTSEATSSQ